MKHVDVSPQTILAPAESKAMVDTFLMPILRQLTEDARRMSADYQTLWQDIETLYKAGGKRLRSYMTLLTYEAFSGTPAKTIIPAAAAQELLHLAMLIHDDIIDRDEIRYGVKNVSRLYLDHYQEFISDQQERQHYANSAAILAGDLLISQAYTLITETNVEPAIIMKAQRVLSKAIFTVIGGELLDTEAVFRGATSADPLLIAEQKTASYSFVSPFFMGATLADASPIQRNILKVLGEQLGIAYQLRDDILGVFGDSQITGKSTDGDIREGKRTLLVEAFYTLATPAQRDEFESLFGRKDATRSEIERVKALLIESGAKESVETLIVQYQKYTRNLIASLEITQEYRDAFAQLIDMCITREK